MSISDDDLALSASPEERYDSGSGVEVAGARHKDDLKSIFAPANRKRLAFYAVTGVVLVGSLFYTFASFSPDVPQGGTGTTTQGRVGLDRESEASESWLQQEERRRYNEEAFADVQKENPMAHPLLDTHIDDTKAEDVALIFASADEPEPEPEPEPEAINPFQPDVASGAPTSIGSAVGGGSGGSRTAIADPQMMNALIESLVQGEGMDRAPKVQSVRWSYTESTPGAGTPEGEIADAGAASPQGGSGAGVCANPLIRAGTMVMATTDLAVNSDVGGPVSVTLRSGQQRNAQLLGSFDRAEKWLRLSLNRMITGDETLAINAIALDVDTTLNAVEGDLDRHLLYRYGWWGFGTVLRAVGQAAEKTADTETIISNGTVIQNSSTSAKRETQIALGELGQDIGEVMQDRINRPITVSLKVGDQVGVFFMDDVCSEIPATSGL